MKKNLCLSYKVDFICWWWVCFKCRSVFVGGLKTKHCGPCTVRSFAAFAAVGSLLGGSGLGGVLRHVRHLFLKVFLGDLPLL